jgi:hypothetical protein
MSSEGSPHPGFPFPGAARCSTSNPDLPVTMNILESQVTDLNYLAQSPLGPPVGMNGQRQSSSAESPGAVANESGNKRKADDAHNNTATHARAKRNRYISIAW